MEVEIFVVPQMYYVHRIITTRYVMHDYLMEATDK